MGINWGIAAGAAAKGALDTYTTINNERRRDAADQRDKERAEREKDQYEEQKAQLEAMRRAGAELSRVGQDDYEVGGVKYGSQDMANQASALPNLGAVADPEAAAAAPLPQQAVKVGARQRYDNAAGILASAGKLTEAEALRAQGKTRGFEEAAARDIGIWRSDMPMAEKLKQLGYADLSASKDNPFELRVATTPDGKEVLIGKNSATGNESVFDPQQFMQYHVGLLQMGNGMLNEGLTNWMNVSKEKREERKVGVEEQNAATNEKYRKDWADLQRRELEMKRPYYSSLGNKEPKQTAAAALKEKADALTDAYMEAGMFTDKAQARKHAFGVLLRDPGEKQQGAKVNSDGSITDAQGVIWERGAKGWQAVPIPGNDPVAKRMPKPGSSFFGDSAPAQPAPAAPRAAIQVDSKPAAPPVTKPPAKWELGKGYANPAEDPVGKVLAARSQRDIAAAKADLDRAQAAYDAVSASGKKRVGLADSTANDLANAKARYLELLGQR